MKRTFLILLFFSAFCATYLSAQSENYIDTSDYYEPFEIPKYRLGVSYSSVLSNFSAIQISNDLRISKNAEVSLELGYIPGIVNRLQGFTFRPSIEQYFMRDEVAGLFIGASFNSTNVWQLYEYTLKHEDAYFRNYREVRRKNEFGLYITTGFKMRISKYLYWETSIGIGQQYRYNSEIPIPDNFFFNTWNEANGWDSRINMYLNGNLSFPLIFE